LATPGAYEKALSVTQLSTMTEKSS
jgi:hypothetical protein